MRRALAIVAVVAATAGCGDDPPEPNRVASQTPKQTLESARTALRDVRSFRMEGYLVDDEDGRTDLTVRVVMPGRIHIRIDQGKTSGEIIVLPGDGFMKANEAYWQRAPHGDQIAPLVKDRWIRAPGDSLGDLGELAKIADPALIGRCLIGLSDIGTLRRAGTGEVDGKPVVVIADKGDVPGGAPGRIHIATSGPALPLRMQQTGPESPGGKPDKACIEDDDPDDSRTLRGDLRLSDYNESMKIEAPDDVLDLDGLGPGDAPRTPA